MSGIDYQQIIENSLNEIYIFHAETLQFIEVNQGARQNLGYTLEELQSLTPLDINPNYSDKEFRQILTPLSEGREEQLVFETQHLRKDGTLYPVEVHLQLNEHNSEKLFIAIILDITKRQILQNRSTELGKIFEKSLNEIYVFDATTFYFIEVNRGARNNLGYTIDELRRMTPIDIKPDYTFEEFNTLVQALKNNGQSQIIFETRHLRKDGTLYPVEVHLQLSTLDGNAVFVAIILDITERKNAQKKLLDLNLKNERSQLIRNFMRDTSHEFRTPLSILSLKSHLLETLTKDEKSLAYIANIKAQVHNIVKLVEGLQKVSVLEATEDINRMSLNIQHLLNSLITDYKSLFSHKNISISTTFNNKHDTIYGDYRLLRNAIYNIIKNACEFTEADGEINVIVEERDTYLHIIIEDTGHGIPKEDIDHIFDYLYRVDKARSIRGGYGLGLSISERIIKLHSGALEVQSELGKGSTFIIKLPITHSEAS